PRLVIAPAKLGPLDVGSLKPGEGIRTIMEHWSELASRRQAPALSACFDPRLPATSLRSDQGMTSTRRCLNRQPGQDFGRVLAPGSPPIERSETEWIRRQGSRHYRPAVRDGR